MKLTAGMRTLRLLVLTGITLTTACVADPYTFRQRGLVASPRAPLYDGQPMTTKVQASGYVATTTAPTASTMAPDSGAAVARDQAGAVLRAAVSPNASIGFALDASWRANETTLADEATASAGVPDDAVYGAAIELRHAVPLQPGFRLGVLAQLGGQSHPIRRDGETATRRDLSFHVHGALVPSWRRGGVTLFGALGAGTESDVPAHVTVTPDGGGDDDPGAVAEMTGAFASAGVGVTIDLGDRAHLTAQGSQAVGQLADYGRRIDVGLTFDLGDPIPPR